MAQKQHEWHQHLGGNADYAELANLQVELSGVIEWFALGIQLEIPTAVLNVIRKDHRYTDDRRLEMLIKWEQLEKPTWTKLIKALNNIGKKRLAKEIAEKYGMRIQQGPNSQLIKTEDIEILGTLVGSGSYGYVKQVKLRGSETIYAGKFFIPRDGMKEKVKKEASILSRLQHPNIVQYIGANTTNDESVLVMELLRMSLQKYLKENPEVPLLMMLHLLHDVSKGLEYLHGEKVIHRDLTVNNVLLDDNGVVTAKVADFGNSRVIDIDPARDIATMTERPGNLLYCAPETMKTPGCIKTRYNYKVDIFSFGHLSTVVVIKQFHVDLLSTSLPELRRLYMRDVEKKLEAHPLVAMIKKCLSKDRDARPSASDLQTELCELHGKEETKLRTEMESDSEESSPDIN